MKIHRKDNFIVAVVLLALVAFFLWQTYTTLPASATASDMGPRFMPTVTLVAIAILSVILLVESFKPYGEGEEAAKAPEDLKSALLFLAVIGIAVFLIRYLGFAVGAFIGECGCLMLMHWKPLKSILFSLVTVAGIVLLFQFLLNVPLPTGMFF